MSVVFSRASGVSWFLACSAPDCWGGWRVVGGSGVRGLARLFPALLFVGGGFGGASARVRFLVVRFWLWSGSVGPGAGVRVLPGSRGGGRVVPGLPLCGGGRVVPGFPLCGGGRVVPGFLFVFAVLLSCSRGVFGCCFFRPALLVFSWFPVLVFVVLPGVGGLWGVSGWVRGSVRPGGLLFLFVGGRVGGLLPFRGGRAGGCACARLSVLLPPCWGGRVRVCVLPGSRGGGRVVPGFFCCLLWWGFSGVVFSVRCFSCLLVLRCLVLCWVVVSAGSGGCGGCRVGFGVVFSPASVVLARACFRFPSWGLVWVWVGFCLESLILAQDERWRRA